MTMVKVSTSAASVTTESTASSSAGIFTPRSNSPDESTPPHMVQSPGLADDHTTAGPSMQRTAPSGETDLNGVPEDDQTTGIVPTSSNTELSQVGILTEAAKGKLPERSTPPVEAGLEDSRLSNPDSAIDVSELAVAINGVARASDRPTTLLQSQSSSSGTTSFDSSTSHRRSSSRVVLAPYNVEDEQLPQDVFNSPAIQQAFGDAKILMSSLVNLLGSHFLHREPDSVMQRLHRDASRLANFRYPSTRTVGLVGDSGVGKSSLLNSLLDCEGLAKASNSGSACTCVVTEYHFHDDNSFTVDVELFTIDEVLGQASALLQSYRHYHLHQADMDEEERNYCEAKADLARDTFRAMFRGRLENERFLIDSPEDSVMGTLQTWVEDMRPRNIGGVRVTSTLNECSTLLMQLTSEQSSTQEPENWPYIKRIKFVVSLKAHILSKGLILVDLPGLRDLNTARQNITERYLLRCDEIFAICCIGRATTDAGVLSVFDLARQAGLSNISIVCTKSDDIRAEEARNDWQGEEAEIIQRLIDAVATDRRDSENIETELSGYTGDDDLTEEDKTEELRLNRLLRSIKTRLQNHEFELKNHLVMTRNGKVTADLENLYRNRVDSGGLNVFCVSNSDYWEHRNSRNYDPIRFLQLSGILRVRRYCISLVSSSQLRIVQKYVRDDVPALLGDTELWVQCGAGNMTAERRQVIRETLDDIDAQLQTHLTGPASQINGIARVFTGKFDRQIYRGRRVHEWSQTARQASWRWSTWHHSTYRVFCQHYGTHSTGAVGQHNWNEESIEAMTRDLTGPWDSLSRTFRTKYESMSRLIEDIFDWANEYLNGEFHQFSDSTTTLCRTLLYRQRLLVTNVEDVYRKFNTNLAMLGNDALSSFRTSFIGNIMERSYSLAASESGTGSDARRKSIIGGTLSQEHLFEELMLELKSRFDDLARGFHMDVVAVVTSHLGVIRETMDIVKSENAALESERDPEFRGRVEREVGLAEEEVRRIQEVMGL